MSKYLYAINYLLKLSVPPRKTSFIYLKYLGYSKVTLMDKGSSYGCYVGEDAIRSSAQSSQDDRVPKGEQVILTNNIRVRFGLHSTIFKLTWQPPFVVCTSTLSVSDKKRTTSLLKSFEKGSKVISDWSDDVSFLVMGEVILTIKVANALAKGVPIITPNYLEDMLNCVKTKQVLPNPKNYVPKLKESTLNPNDVCLEANVQRQSLFKGKLLAFSSQQQMSKFDVAIRYAGGEAVVLDNANPKPEIFQDPNNMLVQADNDEFSKLWIDSLQNADLKGLKPIPEIQIGLAIITMNTVIYCNPASKRQIITKEGKDSSSMSQNKVRTVLANETQIGKTQKRITQVPPEDVATSAILSSSRKNVDETIVGLTPIPSKSQFSAVNQSINDATASMKLNSQLDNAATTDNLYDRDNVDAYVNKSNSDIQSSGLFPVKENISTTQKDSQFEKSQKETRLRSQISVRSMKELKETPQENISINDCFSANYNINESLVKSPKKHENSFPNDDNLFDFDLDQPQVKETNVDNRKRKQHTSFSPDKISTQKRQCVRGSTSDEKEFEADTFDFELSPIKSKPSNAADDNNFLTSDISRKSNKRNRNSDECERQIPSKSSKVGLSTSPNIPVAITPISVQSTQKSNVSSFILTSSGFIGKRTPLCTPKNNVSTKLSHHTSDGQNEGTTVKIEADDKRESLQELTKSFVNLEVISLVVSKNSSTLRATQTFSKRGNVKKFKKQAFLQHGNSVKSKPLFVDLSMSNNTSMPFSSNNEISNRKNNLWSENDQGSQIPYDENNTRNEAEEREVDAFWNFQISQSSQSFSNKSSRRNAR